MINVPAESLEHRIDELNPGRSLVVLTLFIRIKVLVETFDELQDDIGSFHITSFRWSEG